jgi:hypothetical protein
MASATLQQAPEAPEKVNSFGRIIGVIFSPKATFESIVRKPTWLLPTILLSVVGVAFILAFGSRPGAWRAYMEQQFANSSRAQQMTAQQREQALEMQLKITPKVTPVIVPIAEFSVVLIIAAIYWGVFSMGAGIKLNFKTALGITAHAWVPFILSGLLAIVVALLKDPSTLDLNNPLAADVGAYLPTGTSKALVAACHSLDIFAFWVLALFAMGFSAVNPKKLKFGGALGWVVGVWLFYVLAKAGIAAAFS